MSDVLRVARLVRTVLGVVGFWRYGWFRLFAVACTVVGVGVSIGGALGVAVALALGVVAFIVRTGFARGGAHRAR